MIVRSVPAPGPPGPPGDVPLTLEIELTLTRTYPGFHREIVYEPDSALKVIGINTFDSSAKTILIFQKTLTYDSQNKVHTITTVHVPSGATLVKTINRGPNGEFISVDRSYTP